MNMSKARSFRSLQCLSRSHATKIERAMGRGLPEIYAELRAALEGPPPEVHHWHEGPLPKRDPWLLAAAKKSVSNLNLNFQDADIVTIQDFAVACIQTLAEIYCTNIDNVDEIYHGMFLNGKQDQEMADHLRCLLEPIQEEILPPDGPTDWRIWEIFGAAQMQQRQFCILVAYEGMHRSERSKTLIQRFQGLKTSFQQAHSHLAKQIRISSELQTKLNNFETRLSQLSQFLDHDLPKRPKRERGSLTFVNGVEWLQLRCQWLSAEASEIAEEVAQLQSTTTSEVDSWSVISPNPNGHGDVGSVASGSSLVSERSYLSGHGGPRCFLPSHLFKVLLPGEEFPSLIAVKDRVCNLFRLPLCHCV